MKFFLSLFIYFFFHSAQAQNDVDSLNNLNNLNNEKWVWEEIEPEFNGTLLKKIPGSNNSNMPTADIDSLPLDFLIQRRDSYYDSKSGLFFDFKNMLVNDPRTGKMYKLKRKK